MIEGEQKSCHRDKKRKSHGTNCGSYWLKQFKNLLLHVAFQCELPTASETMEKGGNEAPEQ